jgi:hypothetical protein
LKTIRFQLLLLPTLWIVLVWFSWLLAAALVYLVIWDIASVLASAFSPSINILDLPRINQILLQVVVIGFYYSCVRLFNFNVQPSKSSFTFLALDYNSTTFLSLAELLVHVLTSINFSPEDTLFCFQLQASFK